MKDVIAVIINTSLYVVACLNNDRIGSRSPTKENG
jgi:hypothetical protein